MTKGAELIEAFLAATGRTRTGFAAEIDVTRQTLGNVMRGGQPSNETLVKLRAVTGLECLQPEHFTNGEAA